jgi:hypothetical protein
MFSERNLRRMVIVEEETEGEDNGKEWDGVPIKIKPLIAQLHIRQQPHIRQQFFSTTASPCDG